MVLRSVHTAGQITEWSINVHMHLLAKQMRLLACNAIFVLAPLPLPQPL